MQLFISAKRCVFHTVWSVVYSEHWLCCVAALTGSSVRQRCPQALGEGWPCVRAWNCRHGCVVCLPMCASFLQKECPGVCPFSGYPCGMSDRCLGSLLVSSLGEVRGILVETVAILGCRQPDKDKWAQMVGNAPLY